MSVLSNCPCPSSASKICPTPSSTDASIRRRLRIVSSSVPVFGPSGGTPAIGRSKAGLSSGGSAVVGAMRDRGLRVELLVSIGGNELARARVGQTAVSVLNQIGMHGLVREVEQIRLGVFLLQDSRVRTG